MAESIRLDLKLGVDDLESSLRDILLPCTRDEEYYDTQIFQRELSRKISVLSNTLLPTKNAKLNTVVGDGNFQQLFAREMLNLGNYFDSSYCTASNGRHTIASAHDNDSQILKHFRAKSLSISKKSSIHGYRNCLGNGTLVVVNENHPSCTNSKREDTTEQQAAPNMNHNIGIKQYLEKKSIDCYHIGDVFAKEEESLSLKDTDSVSSRDNSKIDFIKDCAAPLIAKPPKLKSHRHKYNITPSFGNRAVLRWKMNVHSKTLNHNCEILPIDNSNHTGACCHLDPTSSTILNQGPKEEKTIKITKADFYFNIKLHGVKNIASYKSWRFKLEITDLSSDTRRSKVYDNIEITEGNTLALPTAINSLNSNRGGFVLSPVDDFHWITSVESLLQNRLLLCRVYISYPFDIEISRSCIYFRKLRSENQTMKIGISKTNLSMKKSTTPRRAVLSMKELEKYCDTKTFGELPSKQIDVSLCRIESGELKSKSRFPFHINKQHLFPPQNGVLNGMINKCDKLLSRNYNNLKLPKTKIEFLSSNESVKQIVSICEYRYSSQKTSLRISKFNNYNTTVSHIMSSKIKSPSFSIPNNRTEIPMMNAATKKKYSNRNILRQHSCNDFGVRQEGPASHARAKRYTTRKSRDGNTLLFINGFSAVS